MNVVYFEIAQNYLAQLRILVRLEFGNLPKTKQI